MIRSGEILSKPAAFVLRCKRCGAWISGLFPGGLRVPDVIPCMNCRAPIAIGSMMTIMDVEQDCMGKYSIDDLIGSNYAGED